MSSIGTIGSRLGQVVLLTVRARVDTAMDGWILIVITDVKTETSRVNVAMTPKQKGAEDWLSEEVENAVEDSLGVRRDDVATFADTPRDRVEEPEEDGEDTADQVDP